MTVTLRRIAAAASLGAILAFASACNSFEQAKDAPRAAVDDTTPAKVIQMPDGFSNIATKCVDGLRYSSIYHYAASDAGGSYGAVSVVADPACVKAGQ